MTECGPRPHSPPRSEPEDEKVVLAVTRPCPCKWQLLWGLGKQSELSTL